jgi:3-hydroxyisobutyrate dehydrogenase
VSSNLTGPTIFFSYIITSIQQAIMKKTFTVGWLGTGVMGEPMAGHLLDAGHSLIVHTRTRSKADSLIAQGAEWANSPSEAAERSDFVFTMLGYPQDVERIYCAEDGVFAGCRTNSVLIDMTTSNPDLAKRIAGKALERHAQALDAPVSGGDIGAKNGTLAIMCGGEKETFDRVLPLFRSIGDKIELFGSSGSGQRVKMANQILIASTMVGTVEALLYAERAKLDPSRVIGLIGQGAAGCWSINQLGPRMVESDWEPGFFVKHFVKDMGIALDDSKRMGLNLRGLALASEFYERVEKEGFADKGTQILLKVLRKMNES